MAEKAKEEAERARKIAQEANRAKSDFLASMSHEIRTPINDILDFSKIESGKMDIIPVDYDLAILLSDTVDMIRSRAEEKKLQLTLEMESNTPVHLHGDEVRLKQIIANILTNAVKYTPEGKVTLTVSGKNVSAGVVQLYVSVKDTGIGIKEEDKERFYAPYAKILVVDDNEMNLKVFLVLLKNHGMQIDTAMSGEECLARIEKNAYHMIFMDHLMPEMDGVETLRRIRELKANRSRDTVIIILTANTVSRAREMFLREGFADYLSKPIIAVKLEEMIQKFLPEELLMKNDLGQKEEIPVGSGDHVKDAQPENGLVDWEKGKVFCMEDEEFYREMLQTFLDSPSVMELRRYYEEADFENYRIKIHAMKANLANIGAMVVSDMAKRLELALKNENNVSYVQENHENLWQHMTGWCVK